MKQQIRRISKLKKKSGKDFTYVTNKKYDGFMGRCYRPKDPMYKNYGGRGIKVTSEWIKSIDAFRDWTKQELKRLGISVDDFVTNSKNLQIDRIDVNGHYSPDNCTYSNILTQARNKSNRVKRILTSAEGEEILV